MDFDVSAGMSPHLGTGQTYSGLRLITKFSPCQAETVGAPIEDSETGLGTYGRLNIELSDLVKRLVGCLLLIITPSRGYPLVERWWATENGKLMGYKGILETSRVVKKPMI